MSQKRRDLFTFHRERTELEYTESVAQGLDSPVVLLLDVSDELGRKLAVAAAGEQAVSSHEESAGSDFDACLITGIAESVARDVLPTFSQTAPQFLTLEIPDDCYRIAIVSDAGMSLTMQELPS